MAELQQKNFLVEQKFLTALRYYIHNAFTELRRRPCYFCLSFFSVAIVVAASAVAQSVIDRAPIIFLKSAEGPAGEVDVQLKANNDLLRANTRYQTASFLNTTRIKEVLPEEYSRLVTPRHDFPAASYIDCKIKAIEEVESACTQKKSGDMITIDTLQEEELGVGRQYPFSELQLGEGIIADNYAKQLSINKGDTIFMELQYRDYLLSLMENACFKKNEYWCNNQSIRIQIDTLLVGIKIVDILDKNYGKVGNSRSKTFVITEQKHLNILLAQHMEKLPVQAFKDIAKIVKEYQPKDFAESVLLNAEDRVELYLESNYDTIQLRLSKMGSQIAQLLGVYPIKIDLPVLSELYNTRFGSMFLGVVLNMIIFILFVLSLMLLYNLLLVSIETKNFELGVLRTLGLNKAGVISLILIQSMSYVFPAIISGLGMSMAGLQFISDALEGQLGVSISVVPTFNAFIFSLAVGILIPVFASIFPIRKALQQELSIALDINRSKSSAVKIEVDVEGKGFPYGRVGFALIATLFGVSIYYFLPLSLLTFNLGLLINIFFWILIGMLIGFILLMLNIQYLIEKMVVYATLFWTGSAMRSLVLKNLGCHRIKNRRVAIMYSLSIAFIIFVWSFSNIQSKSSEFSQKKEHGTYIDVKLDKGFSYSKRYLDVYKFEEFLNKELKDEIASFSWVTVNLDGFMGSRAGYRDVYLTHSGRIYQSIPEIVGVSPNFMNTTFSDEFLDVEKRYDENIDLDIIEELYTARGSQSMIISEKTREFLRAELDYDSSLFIILNNGTYSQQHQMRVSSVINSSPVFTTAGNQKLSVVVSLPTFMRLCGDAINGFDDIPMQKLLIKTVSQDTDVVDKVYGKLSSFLSKNGIRASVWDYRNFQKDVQQQQDVTNMIFTVITVLVMILCFFSLVSSMTANILEQSKEIAVLRAVGLTKSQMIRLYVFEAYTLVFSSSLIGMFVGIAVGFTMGMQRALFTNLPIPFEFPTQIFISIFISSILCSLLSTYTPSKRIMNHQISQIIRMTG